MMRDDIDSLVKFIVETHPDPFYRYPRDKFYQDVEWTKNQFTKSLTLLDFYFAAEPLLAKLGDGHTDLHVMKYYNSTNPLELPYFFSVKASKPFILCKGGVKNTPGRLPAGVEVLSLNGIPAKKIVADIIRLNTGESPAFVAEFGGNHLSFYLEALYKCNGTYRIIYRGKSHIRSVVIKGVHKRDIDILTSKASNKQISLSAAVPNQFILKDFLSVKSAIISFKSFDWNGYNSFIDSAFTMIKNKKINTVAIDLMYNGGGDSDIGDDFLQYLTDKPFRQYDKIVIKNSRLLKERLLAHNAGKALDSADQRLLAKSNGSIDTVFVEKLNPGIKSNRFYGNVIVFINKQTYSSAADFAQCIKQNGIGKIIGEQTGGLIKSFGDIVTTRLPKTGITLTVSSSLYYDTGALENDWHGVVPDHYINPELLKKYSLNILQAIKSNKYKVR